MDGSPAGLYLPAGEVGAIIRKNQFEIAHVFFRVLSCAGTIVSICPVGRYQRARRSVRYTILLATISGKDRFYLRSVEGSPLLGNVRRVPQGRRLQGTLACRSAYKQGLAKAKDQCVRLSRLSKPDLSGVSIKVIIFQCDHFKST